MITEVEIINILSNHKYWCPSKMEQWRRVAKAIVQKIEENENIVNSLTENDET